jgi:hypothetical protein
MGRCKYSDLLHLSGDCCTVPQMQPESKFKKRVDNYFDRIFGHGSFRTCIEKGRGQKSGLPDRFYAALGCHCWAEFKVAPNKLSELQKRTLPCMAQAGTRVVALTLIPTVDLVRVSDYNAHGDADERLLLPLADFAKQTTWVKHILAQTSTELGDT